MSVANPPRLTRELVPPSVQRISRRRSGSVQLRRGWCGLCAVIIGLCSLARFQCLLFFFVWLSHVSFFWPWEPVPSFMLFHYFDGLTFLLYVLHQQWTLVLSLSRFNSVSDPYFRVGLQFVALCSSSELFFFCWTSLCFFRVPASKQWLHGINVVY